MLPVFVVGIAAFIHLLLFDGTVTPEAVLSTVEYPIYLGVILLVGGSLEEPGWRGYLLPRLQERYTAFVPVLLVGVVWTVWHLPLFAIPGLVQSGLSLWLYVPQVLALPVHFTWITNAVGTSVLPAMLLHAGGNTILNYYPTGGVAGAMSTVGLGFLVTTLSVVAVAVVVAYGPETLAPDDERWTGRYAVE